MSGYLGIIADDAAAMLLHPAPVTIGGLILRDHEIPSRISIGGAQAVTIHKAPGGRRTIDAMGADSGAIGWRGVFTGPDAAQRARTLDVMRQQGTPYILSFGDYTFNIVIVHFEYDYQDRGAVISYRIKSEIITDQASITPPVIGLDTTLVGDLASAQTILLEGASSALPYAALATGADAVRINASADDMTSLMAPLDAATTAVASTGSSASLGGGVFHALIQSSGVSLQGAIAATSTGYLSGSTTNLTFTSASALAVAAGDATALAALVRAGGYLNRCSANIASAGAQMPAPLIHA